MTVEELADLFNQKYIEVMDAISKKADIVPDINFEGLQGTGTKDDPFKFDVIELIKEGVFSKLGYTAPYVLARSTTPITHTNTKMEKVVYEIMLPPVSSGIISVSLLGNYFGLSQKDIRIKLNDTAITKFTTQNSTSLSHNIVIYSTDSGKVILNSNNNISQYQGADGDIKLSISCQLADPKDKVILKVINITVNP